MRAELSLTQDGGQRAQLFQDAGTVRPKTHTGADFTELAGPFKNFDGKTRAEQGYPGGNAANAAAYDGDGSFGHQLFILLLFILLRVFVESSPRSNFWL